MVAQVQQGTGPSWCCEAASSTARARPRGHVWLVTCLLVGRPGSAAGPAAPVRQRAKLGLEALGLAAWRPGAEVASMFPDR